MSAPPELPMADSLRREYEQMLVRLEKGRERARRLRELADQATDQVIADERLVRSLAEVLGISAQATIPSGTLFKMFSYASSSWSRPQEVIVECSDAGMLTPAISAA